MMRKLFLPFVALWLWPLLSGCAGSLTSKDLASKDLASKDLAQKEDLQAQVLPTPSAAQGAAALLRRGHEAKANHDADTMMHVAEQMMRLEARPLDGSDMADEWYKSAKAMGAKYEPALVMRGRTAGPGYRNGQISPRGQFVTRQNFYAGQRAEIIIVPLDGARLSLQVSNDEGRNVCRVAASSRNLGCRFVPAYTGANLIEVNNDTEATVSFYIVLN